MPFSPVEPPSPEPACSGFDTPPHSPSLVRLRQFRSASPRPNSSSPRLNRRASRFQSPSGAQSPADSAAALNLSTGSPTQTRKSIHELSSASNGPDALFSVLNHRNNARLKQILEHNPSVANAIDEKGNSALHVAVWQRDLTACDMLLATGADTESTDKDKRTVLHIAANLSADVVDLLCKAKANPNAKDKDGRCPLHHAIEYHRQQSAERLVAWGADINVQDTWGRTPLHLVAVSGNLELWKLLLSKGADEFIKDKSGKTVVAVAEHKNHRQLINHLEDRWYSKNLSSSSLSPMDLNSKKLFDLSLNNVEEVNCADTHDEPNE